MIADRRELYNDQVYRYNTRIAQVPASSSRRCSAGRPREFFAADAGGDAPTRHDLRLDLTAWPR